MTTANKIPYPKPPCNCIEKLNQEAEQAAKKHYPTRIYRGLKIHGLWGDNIKTASLHASYVFEPQKVNRYGRKRNYELSATEVDTKFNFCPFCGIQIRGGIGSEKQT